MKWTTATALLLALSAGGVGVAVVATRKPKEPAEVLAEIRAEMESPIFDKGDALLRLEKALDASRNSDDQKVASQLLETRATLYRDLKAYARSREDLELLLTTYRPGDKNLKLEIAKLQALDGQTFEALQRTRGLTQQAPDFGEGWALHAELEEFKAKELLEEAFQIARLGLPSGDSKEAERLLTELTARDVEDPERDDLVYRLREAFSGGRESDLDEVLARVGEPRVGFRRAREAFAKALASSVAPSTVMRLADSFQRAGRLDLAIQLQFAARRIDSIAKDAASTGALLDDLVAARRIPEARTLLRGWKWELGGSLEFYRSAGEVFFKAGDYAALRPVTIGLDRLGGDTGRAWARFFGGILFITSPRPTKPSRDDFASDEDFNKKLENFNKWPKGLNKVLLGLVLFAEDKVHPEPFLNAKKLAWFHVADGYQALGNLSKERKFLRMALAQLPRHSADSWIRYAETLRQAKKGAPWKEVEIAYTEALNLDPSLTKSIAPLWYEAGENSLTKVGSSLAAVIDGVAKNDRLMPVRSVGPSVLTKLAQSHLDNGRYYEAIRVAEKAREDHPHLVPPLDVIIDAGLHNAARYDVEPELVERIESAGVDDRVESFLRRLPKERLEGKWLVRAIRAQPVRFGKAAVARWYLENGDPNKASDVLADLELTGSPSELRVLRSRLLVESAAWDEAVQELNRLDASRQNQPRTLLLKLRALIGANDQRGLDQVVRQMRQHVPLESPAMLETVDRLMAADRLDLALALVNAMDQKSATRTPEFYRRRILVDLMVAPDKGNATAMESILRAEPYLLDGSPEIAALLLAVTERNWTQLRPLVERLEDSGFAVSAYSKAALALLGERIESGRRAAVAGLQRAPRDPDWAFLKAASAALLDADMEVPEWCGPSAAADAQKLLRGATQRASKDPRDALSIFLVSDSKAWLPWSKPRLAELVKETGSTIWGAHLTQRLLLTEGAGAARQASVEALLTVHPRFGPGHDLAVKLAEEAYPAEPLHPRVVSARALRLDSLGARLINDPIETSIAEAGKLARDGKYKEAVDKMLPVIRSGGRKATQGRIMLSIFAIRADEPGIAAQYLHAAAMGDLGIYKNAALDSLLHAIEGALDNEADRKPQRASLTHAEAQLMLRDLTARYPLDPLVALARLKLQDVAEGERGARARGLLTEMRQGSGGKSLNQLRPGATKRWVEFLAPIAAEVASDLVEDELRVQPGNVELLQLAGFVAEAVGDFPSAKRDYRALLAINPRPETGYSLAEILIAEGATPADVIPLLVQAGRLQGGGSARSVYLRSLADIRVARPGLDDLVKRLAGLWNQRTRSRDEVDPLGVGLLYADALSRRGNDKDGAALDRLMEELSPYVKDSLYEGQFLDALIGVHSAIK